MNWNCAEVGDSFRDFTKIRFVGGFTKKSGISTDICDESTFSRQPVGERHEKRGYRCASQSGEPSI